jgi:hypothetical protein
MKAYQKHDGLCCQELGTSSADGARFIGGIADRRDEQVALIRCGGEARALRADGFRYRTSEARTVRSGTDPRV